MASRNFVKLCSLSNIANTKIGLPLISVKCMSKDSLVSTDTKTHTGQTWKEDDYRLVRFVETPKQVNKQFAIDLIAATPPTQKSQSVVSCDGGGGPTGHPKVYINLDKPGNHSCGYCGLRFYKDDHH